MANLSPQVPSITGSTITYAAATAGGDTVPSGDNSYLIVRNGGGSSITVTLVTPGNEFNAQPIPDTTVTVAAGTDVIVPVGVLYRSSAGTCSVTYSAVTSVTVASLLV